jgi:aspartyl-tRNA(Asn)/glutamyl-tRNA(Gln) amidotransferase subunit C
LKNVVRPDVVVPSLSPADALSGAPASDEQRFKVPQILGDAE